MSPRAARWLPVVQLAAFWPLGVWYFRRVLDSGEDPWGLLALVSAGLLLGRGVAPRAPTSESEGNCGSLWPAAVFTLLYAAVYPVLPNLLCAVLAATAIALVLSACVLRRVLHPGLLGLLWLALPVLPSIEYYAGFPLRVLVTHGAALWLRLAGWAVRPEQAVLNWEGLQVAVDAPCAGLRMMWAGAWLTLTLICLRRLSFRRAVLAAVLALVWILVANILRTAALFLLEIGWIRGPAWLHPVVGVIVFAFAAGGIALTTRGPAVADAESTIPQRTVLRAGLGVWWVSVFLAAASPLLAGKPDSTPPGLPPGWPVEMEGRVLAPLALDAAEREFARAFPGHMAKFTDGTRVVIFRSVHEATRRLHPLETCLRAQGYRIRPAPLHTDAQGRHWGCSLATRASARMRVRTCITDGHGGSWPDVSSWFWSATLGKTQPPWMAVNVVEPVK